MQVARLFQICEREELLPGTLWLLQLRSVKMLMAFIKGIHKHDHAYEEDDSDHNNDGEKTGSFVLVIMKSIFQIVQSSCLIDIRQCTIG